MKEIVMKCSTVEMDNKLDSKYTHKNKRDGDKEPVKLRLRGKGSGYKEVNKKENSETLHLCVSSK
eukprot:CAMPEP_0116909700 /NCGR_PEP_ID=MMETSP0467-20121206/14432_1 /TAXON_ID=283647 /ORGANISM="Mesodinium pulex, Strain SPMC105" /LENGTH=64 /DNA_ID=CAMNT_0004585109 /DNA_START=761 /DNA_END=955 /DNA_ORIENTATION=+